jgi:hypothetical protein
MPIEVPPPTEPGLLVWAARMKFLECLRVAFDPNAAPDEISDKELKAVKEARAGLDELAKEPYGLYRSLNVVRPLFWHQTQRLGPGNPYKALASALQDWANRGGLKAEWCLDTAVGRQLDLDHLGC